jgi:hypothetical protein
MSACSMPWTERASSKFTYAEFAARLIDERSLEESHVYGLNNGAVCHDDSVGGRLRVVQQTLALVHQDAYVTP